MKTYTGIIDGVFDGLIATFSSQNGLHVGNPGCVRFVAKRTAEQIASAGCFLGEFRSRIKFLEAIPHADKFSSPKNILR